MAARKPARAKADEPQGAAAVDAWLAALDHPLKPVLVALRGAIAGADRGIREGIKWNSPSFHFKDWFATAGVRTEPFVRVVLHTGAKAKTSATAGLRIDDPDGLLEWHAKDRASAIFHDAREVKAKTAALRRIVKQWIAQMEPPP